MLSFENQFWITLETVVGRSWCSQKHDGYCRAINTQTANLDQKMLRFLVLSNFFLKIQWKLLSAVATLCLLQLINTLLAKSTAVSNCSAKHQLYTVTQNTSKTGLYKHKYCNELEKEKSHSPKIISILKSESPKRGIVNQIWLNFSLMRSFGQYFAKSDEARLPFRKISKS